MYAIIKTGSKQYRVKEGDIVDVELLNTANESKEVSFQDVLMLVNGDKVKVGAPTISGALVKGEVLSEVKEKKVIIFKYVRKCPSKTKNGHRQRLSRVKITAIEGGK